MNKLYFANKGEFDVRAMLTFGMSAKGKDNAIGFFGTGFKYAVSIILKSGGKVSILSSDKDYVFESRSESFRDKDFDIVYCNGQNAGFTTHLGINWKPWQAFREIYCNCKDEDGIVTDDINETIEFDTVVCIESYLIYQAWIDKSLYFIESEQIAGAGGVTIHQGPKEFVFFRGIAVYGLNEPSLFGYNIQTSLDLTEDRTAKHEYQIRFAIKRSIQNLKDKALIREILSINVDCMERNVSYDIDFGYSPEFIEVARELLNSGAGLPESARAFLKKVDEKSGNWPEFEPTTVQKTMMSKALSFLACIGVNADKYPIVTVDGLGDGVMGRAMDKTIYLSRIPFNMGTKQVASTLLEEWVHNEFGCEDFDRKMQNWLFDKILSLSEEAKGEPL